MLVWAWSGDVSAVSADLHCTDVPAVIGVVRSSGALPVTKLSLEFLVLTAARSGEVRFASWEEMDP